MKSPTTPLNLSYGAAAALGAAGLGVIALVQPDAATFGGFLLGLVLGVFPIFSWHMIIRFWLDPDRPSRPGVVLAIVAAKVLFLTGGVAALLAFDVLMAINVWALLIGMVLAIQTPLVLTLLGQTGFKANVGDA